MPTTDERFKGGYAYMLDLAPEEERAQIATAWAEVYGAKLKKDWHLTLQFVGRDLGAEVAMAMIDIAMRLEPTCFPLQLGRLAVFETRAAYHLVCLVGKGFTLVECRDSLRLLLTGRVRWKDDFAFNPHVTLAELPKRKGLLSADVVIRDEDQPQDDEIITPTALHTKLGKTRFILGTVP